MIRGMATTAWLILFLAAATVQADVLVTRTGTEYEGQVVERGDNYELTRPDGKKMTFPKAAVREVQRRELASPAEKTPPAGPRPSTPRAGSTPGAEVTVDLGDMVGPAAGKDGQKKDGEKKPDEKLMEVAATGVAVDAEKAVQAAFSQAIEQAVGVLVDAETLVKNEQVVHDQILTFSRGFVRTFEVVRRWEQDGLHHARIKALVEVGKLSEKLRGQKIAVREVPGELLYRQVTFDIQNEKQAVEMFQKAMDAFQLDGLTKVKIEGKPDVVEKDDIQVTLRVNVSMVPDMVAWAKFLQDLEPLLAKLSSGTDVLTLRMGEAYGGFMFSDAIEEYKKIEKRLGKEASLLLNVFKGMNGKGNITYWKVYKISAPLAEALCDIGKRTYRLHVALEDAGGNELAAEPIDVLRWSNSHEAQPYFYTSWRVEGHFIGPLLFWKTNAERFYCYPALQECRVKVPVDKLRNVKKVTASLRPKWKTK
ncbi:MAG: hypothetical protein BWX88_00377 [Planctomycetes bacterium ADurb.Bin126]|nr:MAG: hypothetical protein BWX88_00377 [Planctomycetes bacterium ADurb.Bin126]HOD81273.1 hypothetical protein [Phycisphaerae bacterium]HQL71601.1 hypothetical protein [Phycisphaerae bacterium]